VASGSIRLNAVRLPWRGGSLILFSSQPHAPDVAMLFAAG